MKNGLTTTGYVLKEEKVSALKGHTVKNTFVININHPFPGYYGQAMVDQSVPRSIIFITKKEHSWESILRAKQRINKYLDLNVDISKSKVSMWNKKFDGIRAKGFSSFSEIEPVQKALIQEGFAMMKSRRMGDAEEALINLKKFYYLEPIDDGIFLDRARKEMSYVLLDKQVNWEVFRKITEQVKNNISDSSFDIANGAFYMDDGIVDMVRIFKPTIKPELLREIKNLYRKNVQKFG
ncbi:MAG TPA: hypothetical protein ENK85_02430 [Saprospiraceae bacterium]|nr:hypothetical protein [Saprospiraceae bacterium]